MAGGLPSRAYRAPLSKWQEAVYFQLIWRIQAHGLEWRFPTSQKKRKKFGYLAIRETLSLRSILFPRISFQWVWIGDIPPEPATHSRTAVSRTGDVGSGRMRAQPKNLFRGRHKANLVPRRLLPWWSRSASGAPGCPSPTSSRFCRWLSGKRRRTDCVRIRKSIRCSG